VVSDEPVHPTVYCTHGRFDGLLYCKRCPTCRAKHNLSYAEEWTTFADEPPQLVVPLRYALSHAWLAWTLLRWRDELQLPKEPLSFASPTHLDETLLDYTMRRDPKTGRFDSASTLTRSHRSLHRQVGKGARARLPRAQGRQSNLLVLHH